MREVVRAALESVRTCPKLPAMSRAGRRPAVPDLDALLGERARRQHLAPSTRLRDSRGLLAALRALQPVAPRSFTFPGTPPQLAPRVTFDDLPASEDLRRRGAIVKGRFAGGMIAYVVAEDLPVYAAAYRRPADRLSPEARAVLELIESEGPTVRSDLKALLEMPGRRLSAALIELQRAFLLTELQYETEWDNAWTLLADEHPAVAAAALAREEAIDEVLARALEVLAFATTERLVDRGGFGVAATRASLARLAAAGRAEAAAIDGVGDAWLAPGAAAAAARAGAGERFEAVLDPQDALVLAHRRELARRYGRSGVLAYVVVDGRFAGAAFGRWGINPFDVDDVRLDAPYDAQRERREAILAGLRTFFPPPAQRILRWHGEPIGAPPA